MTRINAQHTAISHDNILFGEFISIGAICKMFWRARWIMLSSLLLCALIGQTYLWFAPRKFTAVATITEKGAKSSSMAGSDSILGKLLSTGSSGSPQVMSMFFALQSRALAERVVKSLQLDGEWLQKRIDGVEYAKMSPEDRVLSAVAMLQGKVVVKPDKENKVLVNIAVTDKDPKWAKVIVEQALIELQYLLSSADFLFNQRDREFYEARLEALNAKILAMGAEFSRVYTTKGISSTDSTFRHESPPVVAVDPNDADELGVSSLNLLGRVYGVDQERIRQLRELRDEDRSAAKIDVPQQVYIQYLQDRFDMLRQLRQSIAQQFETSLIESLKEEQRFVIVDAPLLPRSPSSPNVMMIRVVSLCLGLFLSFWAAIAMHVFRVSIPSSERGHGFGRAVCPMDEVDALAGASV